VTAREDHGERLPQYLTTREVADLLRVKERKVYDLAASGEIPHRRLTGKLLFPRVAIEAWLAGNEMISRVERPSLLVGSHDPLLDWAIRESGCGLASLIGGSMDGLNRFAAGEAAVAGLHLPETDGWNVQTVEQRGLRDCVLIGWAKRTQGLMLGTGAMDRVRGIADLRGRSIVLRQPGAGGRAVFDRLASEAGVELADFKVLTNLARTESDAAAAVASGEADAALGLEAMSRQFRLDFVPIVEEKFDLLIDRRSYFTPPLQALCDFARSEEFRNRADALGGYDVSGIGTVRWLSP
jgi:excisionase family DNA binding protein